MLFQTYAENIMFVASQANVAEGRKGADPAERTFTIRSAYVTMRISGISAASQWSGPFGVRQNLRRITLVE